MIITTLLVWQVASRQTEIAKDMVKTSNRSTIANEQSLEIQRISMQISNRAYISITQITPGKIKDFTNIKVRISFTNTGQTPAYQVSSHSLLTIRESLIDTFPTIDTNIKNIDAIVLGKNSYISIMKKITLNDIQINKLNNKSLFLIFIGSVF